MVSRSSSRLRSAPPQRRSAAAEAVDLARGRPIDVALLGNPSGDSRGVIALTRDLRRLPTPPAVLLYAADPAADLAAAAMVAGAAGLLMNAELADGLGPTVRKVATGGAHWPRVSSPWLLHVGAQLPPDDRSVFQMWTASVPDDAIARLHGLSETELEDARERILRTLWRSSRFGRPRHDDGSWPLSWARSRKMRGRRA